LQPSTVVVFGALFLATAVIAALEHARATRGAGPSRSDVDDVRQPAAALPPAYVVNVSRPGQPWRWTSVLLAPLELLVIAWSIPARQSPESRFGYDCLWS
jgi:hypothetical protein